MRASVAPGVLAAAVQRRHRGPQFLRENIRPERRTSMSRHQNGPALSRGRIDATAGLGPLWTTAHRAPDAGWDREHEHGSQRAAGGYSSQPLGVSASSGAALVPQPVESSRRGELTGP